MKLYEITQFGIYTVYILIGISYLCGSKRDYVAMALSTPISPQGGSTPPFSDQIRL